MPLDTYRQLGRSGLRVSPLSLGTMTFGRADWGCDADTARELLELYVDAGGNFVDTADMYGDGASEELVGQFLSGRRDRVVLATKYSLGARTDDDPNGAGNSRKNMLRVVAQSLRRLGVDYIDVLYLHAWDAITSPEEAMRALDDLVTAGTVRYVALSDVPAWYAARAQTIAEWRGYEPVCALQLEYSLIERGIEYEFPALGDALGMGLVTWSPLANGLLSGKYRNAEDLPDGRIRTNAAANPGVVRRGDERAWATVRATAEVAAEVGRSPAQVAVSWVAHRPGVASVILGATSTAQLRDTLQSLDVDLPSDAVARLTSASAPPPAAPYAMYAVQQRVMNRGVVACP